MDWEELESEFEKALVRVAEFKAKGKSIAYALRKLRENDDIMGMYFIGFLIGAVNGVQGMDYAWSVIHNFNVAVDKIREGVSKDTIVKALERARKEGKRISLMEYGSV